MHHSAVTKGEISWNLSSKHELRGSFLAFTWASSIENSRDFKREKLDSVGLLNYQLIRK
jgi:hypothetical protein